MFSFANWCRADIGDAQHDQMEHLYHGHIHAARMQETEGSPRKFAPDKKIDVEHLSLDVTPDFEKRTVQGTMEMAFAPIAKPLPELRLDAVDLSVHEVNSTVPLVSHHNTGEELVLTFETPVPAGTQVWITVRYEAQPSKGLYFRTPELGYPEQDTHIWTQGETHEARHWFPSYDYPNEKFTTEITCRVPEGMIVLSNGKEMHRAKNADTGLVEVRWLQSKPHVNYLICLVAGSFKALTEEYNGLELRFYAPPTQFEYAANSFQGTREMMTYFEQEIGVAYPWHKYDQVCVYDPHFGGMENTGLTTLTMNTLFPDSTENIRSSQGLVAHELAHQWFGDLVTCKDWSHLWLNEGFATYYELLYDGHARGKDHKLYGLYRDAHGIFNADRNNPKPIVYREYKEPGEQFSYLAYPKGSWVLHMLRSQLGEDLFRRCVQRYLNLHQYESVVTEDLNSVIQELSGRNYDRFFDQWVYHAHHPELKISYSWEAGAKLAKLSVRQDQKISNEVLLFEFPLTFRFRVGDKTVDREVLVDRLQEDFYFPLAQAPDWVRVDPDYTLLAEIDFKPSDPIIHAWLKNKEDVIGRLLAVEQLGKQKDHKAVEALKTALNNDPFYGVRVEAAEALRKIHTDDSLEALFASQEQNDARVRRAVIEQLGRFYRESVFDALTVALTSEKNPDIVREVLRAVPAFDREEVNEILRDHLERDSFHQIVATAAVEGMRATADPSHVDAILNVLIQRKNQWPGRNLDNVYRALGYLGNFLEQEEKAPVRQFLADQVNDPRDRVQRAAIHGLGLLGDPRAVPLLETFAAAAEDQPTQRAAEEAIRKLRSEKPVAVELGDLRSEVMELQKSNREFKDLMEELKKKLEALQGQEESRERKESSPDNADNPEETND